MQLAGGLEHRTVGARRLLCLQSLYSKALVDVGVYETLSKQGLHNPGFKGLEHLKVLSYGDHLGPLFTFDGSVFNVRQKGHFEYREQYVVGIRYDQKEDVFFRVVMSFESFTPLNQANTFALLY